MSAGLEPGAPRPTAVVFDFGGVLFDWRPALLLQQVLPRHARDQATAAHWAAQVFVDGGDWLDFDRGTVEPVALVQRIATRTGLAPAEVQAVVDAVPGALQPLPETVALVQALQAAGCPLFYLSNMPAPLADLLLQRHGFLGCFQDGVFSARVRMIKPEPGIFALAAQRFGRPPGHLLFFDDVVANVAAARQAGWQAAQFTGAAAAREALQDLGLLPAA